MKKNQLTRSLFCCLVLVSPFSLPAYAWSASNGIDTPSGVKSLPLSVQGVVGCELDANTTDATKPPNLNCAGPIGEGAITNAGGVVTGYATLINTDGSMTIGSNAKVQPSSVLTINGATFIGPDAFSSTATPFPYLGVNTTNDSSASFTTSNTFRSEIWINDTTSTMWGLAVSGSVPGSYPAQGSFYILPIPMTQPPTRCCV